ncbi:MAG TPA: hypothetical protein VGC18_15455 [Lacisediminihabitans sp.]|uniref:hypothetical protein n=1 Tax=Lacisediminihabitans sp. TaxID=2787631 RepID=UPI002ED9F6FD
MALATTGCSTQAPGHDAPVATLVTPDERVPTTTPSPDADGRPRERLDMNASDLTFLYSRYDRCMADHGVTGLDDSRQGSVLPGEAISQDALDACAALKPLPAWEKDRSNPQAVDFAIKVIDCLRSKGVRYVELYNEPTNPVVGEVFGGPRHDTESNVLGQKYMPVCEQQVYKEENK